MSAGTDPGRERGAAIRTPSARARPRGAAARLDRLIYLVLVGVIVARRVLTAVEGRNFFSPGNIWAHPHRDERPRLHRDRPDPGDPRRQPRPLGALRRQPHQRDRGRRDAWPVDGNIVPAAVLNTLAVCALDRARERRCIVSCCTCTASSPRLGTGLIISGYLATNYQGSHGAAPPAFRLLGAHAASARCRSPRSSSCWAARCWRRSCCAAPGSATTSTPSAATREVARISGIRTAVPVIAAHVLCSMLAARRRAAAARPARRRQPDRSASRAATTCCRSRRSSSAAPCCPAARAARRHHRRRRDLRGHRQRHGRHAGQPVPQGRRPRRSSSCSPSPSTPAASVDRRPPRFERTGRRCDARPSTEDDDRMSTATSSLEARAAGRTLPLTEGSLVQRIVRGARPRAERSSSCSRALFVADRRLNPSFAEPPAADPLHRPHRADRDRRDGPVLRHRLRRVRPLDGRGDRHPGRDRRQLHRPGRGPHPPGAAC